MGLEGGIQDEVGSSKLAYICETTLSQTGDLQTAVIGRRAHGIEGMTTRRTEQPIQDVHPASIADKSPDRRLAARSGCSPLERSYHSDRRRTHCANVYSVGPFNRNRVHTCAPDSRLVHHRISHSC